MTTFGHFLSSKLNMSNCEILSLEVVSCRLGYSHKLWGIPVAKKCYSIPGYLGDLNTGLNLPGLTS